MTSPERTGRYLSCDARDRALQLPAKSCAQAYVATRRNGRRCRNRKFLRASRRPSGRQVADPCIISSRSNRLSERPLRGGLSFALIAAHESASGTSRHFAALLNLVAIGVIADIVQAALALVSE